MKTTRFNFYSGITMVLIVVIISAAIALFFSSCELLTQAVPPIDHPNEEIIIDTTETDTIIPIEVDTCTELIEYTTPEFVTAYWFTDDNITTDRVIIIGNHSQTVFTDNIDQQAQIIDSLFALTWPNYNYKTYVGQDNRKLFTIIDGTNDRQQFYLKAQIRINGYKQYFGFSTQGFTFGGAADPVVYNELISLYPSVNQFDFYGTDWTEDEYIKTALKVIGECKEGRWRAHFGLQPNYTFPDSIIQKAENAGWEKVLHAPMPYGIVDLRGQKDIDKSLLFAYANSGKQIIVD